MITFLQFGRYSADGLIGRGAAALVYRGRDSLLRRDVAIKVLRGEFAGDPLLHNRFVDEAKALARLNHENIVRVFDVGVAGERPFFAMELIDGLPLDLWLGGSARLTLGDALFVLHPLAAAVDALHSAGLVHGDIGMACAMIDSSGRVVLMDPSVARATTGASDAPPVVDGDTLSSAEAGRRSGFATPRSDLCAFGLLAYQMLAGQTPARGDEPPTSAALANAAARPLRVLRPDVPEAACAAVDAMLANEPQRRPASAADFVGTLEAAAAGVGRALHTVPPLRAAPTDATMELLPGALATATPPFQPRQQRPVRQGTTRWQRTAAMLAIVLSLGVLALIVLLVRQGATPSSRPNVAGSPLQTPPGASLTGATPAAALREGAAVTTAPQADRTSAATTAGSFAVKSFVVQDTNVWTTGAGPLQACVGYDGASLPASVRVRVASAADPATPLVQSEPTPLNAGTGQICLPLPSAGAVATGDYVALLFDQNWQERGSYAFNVAAAPDTVAAAPSPTSPAAAATSAAPVGAATTAPAATAQAQGAVSPPSLAGQAGNSTAGPVPLIAAVTPQSAVAPGQDFSFSISAVNEGADGALSSITVSSAEVTQMTARVGSCTMAATAQALPPSSSVAVLSGGYMRGGVSSAWLAELDALNWPSGATCSILVTARMPASGSATFLLRTTIEDSSRRVISSPVSAASADQQGFPAISWTVPSGR